MEDLKTQSLKEALELIKEGKREAAGPILVELLKEDQTLEQAWFLLSYTLSDPERQVYALEQALRLNPGFERAGDRLEKLRATQLEVHEGEEFEEAEATSDDEPPMDYEEEEDSLPSLSPFYDLTADAFEDERDNEEETREEKEEPIEGGFDESQQIESPGEEKKPEGRRVLAISSLLLLILAVVAVFFARGWLLDQFEFLGVEPVVTVTPIQGFRTLPPTWTSTPEPGAMVPKATLQPVAVAVEGFDTP